MAMCNRCGAALENSKEKPLAADPFASTIRDIDYEIWIAEQLGEYIRFQTANSLPGDFSYADTLHFWIEKFAVKLSKPYAKELGASQAAMTNWLRLGAIPRLRRTMDLCWVFGVSLLQFLQKTVPKNHDGKLRKSIDQGARYASASTRRRIDKNALESALSAILRENRYALMSFTKTSTSSSS